MRFSSGFAMAPASSLSISAKARRMSASFSCRKLSPNFIRLMSTLTPTDSDTHRWLLKRLHIARSSMASPRVRRRLGGHFPTSRRNALTLAHGLGAGQGRISGAGLLLARRPPVRGPPPRRGGPGPRPDLLPAQCRRIATNLVIIAAAVGITYAIGIVT